MSHNDHRHAICGQVAHDAQHLAGNLGVESGGWLIEKHQIRLHAQGTSNGHALLLATGKSGYVGMGKISEAHRFEMTHSRLLGLVFAHFLKRDGGERTVVQHVHVVKEVESLEHHADLLAQFVDVYVIGGKVCSVEPYVARIGGFQQVEAAQKRRLARAGCADDGDHLARHDGKLDIAQNDVAVKRFAQPFNADDGLNRRRGGRSCV